jgi:SAM-dependent methyltransferase
MMHIKDALIPPDELIIQNGIGVGDLSNVRGEFDAIGRGLIGEMIGDGFIKPDRHVLDLGCGLGRLARALVGYLSTAGSYRGVDVTRSSIDWCAAHYAAIPNFGFVHADVFNTHYNQTGKVSAAEYVLPFGNEQFDFIWSTSLFTHMLPGGIDNYLAEIARVLKPDGHTWNTYMLLDEVSEPLARAHDPQRPNVQLSFDVPGGLVAIPEDPEVLIGVYADRITKMHTRHGLRITDIRFGPWSGRTANLRASYQDVMIATKPSAS